MLGGHSLKLLWFVEDLKNEETTNILYFQIVKMFEGGGANILGKYNVNNIFIT